jgi:hypothetical protein
MIRYLMPRRLRRPLALAAVVALPALGCTSALLDVTDPDIILQATSASAAIALHNGAALRMAQAVSGTQGPDALFMFGGLLTDEWKSGDTFIQRNTMDQRIFDYNNTFNAGPFRNVNRVRTQALLAIDGLRTYLPDSAAAIARMFDYLAYTEVLLGEHYCNGVPLSGVSGSTIVFGEPISNDSLFKLAIAHADTALAIVRGPDSARVAQFANVIKGRALIDRGTAFFPAAAAAVATVPLAFHYDVTHSLNTNDNQMWALNPSARRYTMGDLEGGNGLPYVSANDPRLPNRTGPESIFDSAYPFLVVKQGIFGRTSAVPLVSGIEAQLIVAEAALEANDPTTWLTIINTLRTNTALYPAAQTGFTRGPDLTALADPGTPAARVDQMFYERAFWMFSTGHRLGDMRRLMRQYGRAVNTVYPTGAWFKGGTYGDAIQMTIPVEEQNNPNFVTCADRNP